MPDAGTNNKSAVHAGHRADLVPHLFRTEFRKIVSVLTRTLGSDHLETAEDIVAETFAHALEVWPYKGVPPNATAWLYTVARHKAINHLRRLRIFHDKVGPDVKAGADPDVSIDLSEENIVDSQLKMLFAICHPSIPVESQIALGLRVLCGFGIEEIANAFLTSKETVNKRLHRAKEKLRSEKIPIELPQPAEIAARMDSVLKTLYLLFNEGYYSESHDAVIREDLCLEAMRLNYLLLENKYTDIPAANALLALMCFHSSRLPARKDEAGRLVLYDDQNSDLWDQQLISRGAYYLHRASGGTEITTYHLQAAIASWHTVRGDSREKWESILQLYNKLLMIEYSSIAALNRTFALSKANSREEAIVQAEKLALNDNPYYHLLLAELKKDTHPEKARDHLLEALSLARTKPETQIIQRKLDGMSLS